MTAMSSVPRIRVACYYSFRLQTGIEGGFLPPSLPPSLLPSLVFHGSSRNCNDAGSNFVETAAVNQTVITVVCQIASAIEQRLASLFRGSHYFSGIADKLTVGVDLMSVRSLGMAIKLLSAGPQQLPTVTESRGSFLNAEVPKFFASRTPISFPVLFADQII